MEVWDPATRTFLVKAALPADAKVRPGNSGGPLVSPDGTVEGMIFAASTTNSGIGYALTAAEISRVLSPSVGRTRPVDTGPCV